MITYELAKKLKDAGFPQKILAGDKYYDFVSHPRMGIPPQQALHTSFIDTPEALVGQENWTKIPSLSELIEACGEGFEALTRHNKGKGWTAWKVLYGGKKPGVCEVGETYDEAVANLWLGLNKKDGS